FGTIISLLIFFVFLIFVGLTVFMLLSRDFPIVYIIFSSGLTALSGASICVVVENVWMLD
ncbi:TPA: hypothetical protein ACGOV7_002122, partial [Streptococcus suis]